MSKGEWGAYAQTIWDLLLADIRNPIGVAALMGNLWGESNLIPFRKQGDYTPGYTASIEYTDSINDFAMSEDEFANDGVGYGLAQWTNATRKRRMHRFWVTTQQSIGSTEFQVSWLLYEIKLYFPDLYVLLRDTSDLNSATDYVLDRYEAPLNPEFLRPYRRQYALGIYTDFYGVPIKKHKMKFIYYMRRDRWL